MVNGKIKILYIHHSGQFGGAPKSLSYIIKNIDLNKYTPYLVNIANGPINQFFSQLPVKLIINTNAKPFHGSTVAPKSLKLFLKNWLYLLPSIITAYFLLKKLKPDLIHLNSTCLFAFAIAARLVHIPVISHVREPLRKGIWGQPLRFFCKKCIKGFIAISNYDLSSLKIGNKNYKIYKKVVYNFVDMPLTLEGGNRFREELKIPEKDIIFLYLARFAKGNGWEELIEMAKRIIEKKTNYHFVLAGADRKIDKPHHNIHILPFRQDVSDMLYSSDIFVCPFTEPHFARGVIEASAYGLPVIGANIGGVNELIKHQETGYLYNDFKEFSSYAIKLGESKVLRRQLGMKGKQFADEKFNMVKNLKETYDFYSLFRK